MMYSERKAAQVAVWLLRQDGGRMPHLKLIKLMYLADRQSMADTGFPITFDRVVSMPHGPVLSMTLSYINGDVESGVDGWEAWVNDRENHEVALRDRPANADALDELSEADIEALERVWARFGRMTKWQLRDYTHEHCPEWVDPQGSMLPIATEQIFQALGYTANDARRAAQRVDEQDRVDRIFAAL
jgi:uncharacterized phage-associated protein